MNTIVIEQSFETLRPFIEGIKKHFSEDATIIHDSRNVLKIFDIKKHKIVVKSFKIPNIINQIVYSFFRDSKAKRSYMYSQKLIELGINTPKPIAYVEHKFFGLFKQSYYICEHFDFDFEIRAVLANENFVDRDTIYKEFAAFSFKLHNAGVYHVDYSPGNVLIKKEENNYLFYVVDVNRMKFIDYTNELRMKNLSRFSANEKDTIAIATYYAEVSGVEKAWCIKKLQHFHNEHQEYIKQKATLKKMRGQ